MLLIWNVITFALMGIDKLCARRSSTRIPENVLLVAALFMGASGVLLGMFVFRHKIRSFKFGILVPLMVVANCAVLVTLV